MTTRDLSRLARARELAATGEAKRIRVNARLTLSEFADACEVDTSTIWRWEVGRRSPRGAAAVRYARLLESLAGAA